MIQKLSSSVVRQGFLQAVGVTLYCSAVGFLFWKVSEIFGRVPNYAGPVAFLLLFIVSALTCGLIVFYTPYQLFFDGKKKEAADLVVSTAGWLFAFFLLFLSIAALFRRQGSGREVACTMEAKLCPDGTAVGRVGPNCDFAPCPGE